MDKIYTVSVSACIVCSDTTPQEVYRWGNGEIIKNFGQDDFEGICDSLDNAKGFIESIPMQNYILSKEGEKDVLS